LGTGFELRNSPGIGGAVSGGESGLEFLPEGVGVKSAQVAFNLLAEVVEEELNLLIFHTFPSGCGAGASFAVF